MAITDEHGKTPILDLLVPLPRPRNGNLKPGQYLLPAALITGVVITRNYLLLIPIAGLWAIILLAIGVHELGHIAAGCALGFSFQSVGIGPIWIKRESAQWTLKLRSGLLDGATSMCLDRIYRVRRRLIVFIAAGPVAGLLMGAVGLACLRVAINHEDSFLCLIMACFAGYSIFANLMSLIPAHYRGSGNDAMLLKALLWSRKGAEQMVATYALAMQQSHGTDLFCLNPRWIRLASSPVSAAMNARHVAFSDDLNSYQNAGSEELAAQFLERCLANSAFLNEGYRDALVVEAAVFTAWRRNDVKKADIWLGRVANPLKVHPLIRLRAEAALSIALGRFDDALRYVNAGLEVVGQLSVHGARERNVNGWLRWRREIETRQRLQVVASS